MAPDRQRLLVFLGVLLAFLLFIIATYRDYGISWDESYYLDTGAAYIAHFFDMERMVEDAGVEYHLRTHGALVDAIYAITLSALGQAGSYESLHLTKALYSCLSVVLVYLLLCRLAPRRLVPVAGALLLVFFPAWLGHIFDDHMDGSSTLLYALQMVLALHLLSWDALVAKGSLRAVTRMLGFAIVAAVAFSHRVPLLAVPAVYFGLLLAQVRGRAQLGHFCLLVGVFCVCFFATLFVVDPHIRMHPATGFLERLAFAANPGIVSRLLVLFDGEVVMAGDLPRSYLVRWMAMSIPAATLLLLGVGLARLAGWLARPGEAIERLQAAFLMSTLLLPILAVILTHAVVFDAWRHFLFLTIPIVVIAALGLDGMVECAGRRWAPAVAVAFLAGLAAIGNGMVRLHPYEYIYINALAGGLAGIDGRYEMDYWAKSNREAALWIREETRADPLRTYSVYACGSNQSVAYYLPKWLAITDDLASADYAICVRRAGGSYRAPGRPPDHTIEREGVVLTRIWKRTGPTQDGA